MLLYRHVADRDALVLEMLLWTHHDRPDSHGKQLLDGVLGGRAR